MTIAEQTPLSLLPVTPLDALPALLARSAALHNHLCPRQVLGARTGLRAARELELPFPRTDKRVLVFVETDGCFADGVSVASGCWLGRRTMRLVDHGKVAATFVDLKTGRALRIIPRTDLRARVRAGRGEQKRWDAYLDAYQTWPDDDLLTVTPVTLTVDLKALVSVAGKRAVCETCGEEIINEREVVRGGRILCRDCAGDAYWQPANLLRDLGACLGEDLRRTRDAGPPSHSLSDDAAALFSAPQPRSGS